jgi:hypothetical protein
MITRTCVHARSIIDGRYRRRLVNRNVPINEIRTFCLLADKTWLFVRPDTEVDDCNSSSYTEHPSNKCYTKICMDISGTLSMPHQVVMHAAFAQVHRINEAYGQTRLWIARDDLLHPIVGGNKYRKLDAVIPALVNEGITDVVSSQPQSQSPAVAGAMTAILLLDAPCSCSCLQDNQAWCCKQHKRLRVACATDLSPERSLSLYKHAAPRNLAIPPAVPGLLCNRQVSGCMLSPDGMLQVTCGGQQSAHTAAVAAACAEHGMLAHLLVRGEAPEVPTGYGLMARMYGKVHYISRQEYADRLGMTSRWAEW